MSEDSNILGIEGQRNHVLEDGRNLGYATFIAPIVQVQDEGGEGSSGLEGGRDDLSGVSDGGEDQAPFEPPSGDLRDRIIKQVEFYFSDANILKDAFLLKHVRRNKQGYVSLKLVTKFKKMKSLTKDYRVVAYSLKFSDKLEVNAEGLKVRRVDPLPEYDETVPSRTVVAVNLPFENPTIADVSEIFSACGEVVLIRILRPSKPIPPDIKKHLNKHPEIGTTMCAVIEYEKHESARDACTKLTSTEDWRKGMRVALLAPVKDKSKKGTQRDRGEENKNGNNDLEGKVKTKQHQHIVQPRRNSRVEELAQEEMYKNGSSSSEQEDAGQVHIYRHIRSSLSPTPDPNRLSPNATPKSSPRTSPRASPKARRKVSCHGKSPLVVDSPSDSPRPSPRGSPEVVRKNSAASEGSTPSSPWVQRRLKAASESMQTASPGTSPRLGRRLPDGSLLEGSSSPRMANMEGIIRLPKGPDGTRGFYDGMGRGKPAAV